MARETLVRLVDDLDQSQAATTVRFGWQGANYEVDLSAKNAKALEAALAPYVQAARRVTGRGRRATTRSAGAARRSGPAAKSATPGIREWAAGQGYTVAARGRIPAAVVEAYQAAQGGAGGADGAPAKKAAPRKATKSSGRKAAARKATGRGRRATRAAGSATPNIREWANSNGYTVGPRGRIPTVVIDAYNAAQGGAAAAPAKKAAPRKATKSTRATKRTARKATARKATGRRGRPAKKAVS